ncbi:MAG: GtrA family protein [Oscillospiraceae bacterium]|nr:GtrA family protein [Oscillospiraceae bacterium]
MIKFSREALLYLIYGVLTTIVNYSVFSLCYFLLFQGTKSLAANAIAFVFAVAFAFVTNKIFVFKSKSWEVGILKKELTQFVGARFVSFLFEEAGLFVCDELLQLGRINICSIGSFSVNGVIISKIVLSVLVVIINYILCKFVIFRKKHIKGLMI